MVSPIVTPWSLQQVKSKPIKEEFAGVLTL